MGKKTRGRGVTPIITTLYNVHEKEAVTIFKNRPLPTKALSELFRCRGFAFQEELDPRLLETMLAAAIEFRSPKVTIISAYRSPKFNDALAKKGRRVARESKHTKGEALDFRLSTITAGKLGAWLWDNFEGGIGTYKGDNFVHIDVGPKRRWQGK